MNRDLYPLIGVVVGAFLSWPAEVVRYEFRRRQRAKYLAVRIAIFLDSYVTSCASTLMPDPLEADAPDVAVALPEQLHFPDDVDWTSIEATLAYDLLSLPNKDKDARESVSFMEYVGDSWQAKDTRDDRFSSLGLSAHELANRVRRSYGIPDRPCLEWNPVDYLKETNQRMTARTGKGSDTELGEVR